MAVLPVIDLALAKRDSKSRSEVAQSLLHALETTGFFYVKGIDGYNEEELLKLTKWFYSLPHEVKWSLAKKSFNKNNKNLYKGYFPEQPEYVSHKEGFEIIPEPEDREGLVGNDFFYEDNVWPEGYGKKSEWFKNGVLQYYNVVQKAGEELLSLIAEAVGLDKNWWDELLKPFPLSILRLIRYPRRKGPPPPAALDGDKVMQCEEHTDSGLLTLLSTFHYSGLQIRDGGPQGPWKDVPPLHNHLVVNIADMMAEMSGHRFKSTKHRVLDTGEERFSVPHFFEPSFQADISPRQELLHKNAPPLRPCPKLSYGVYCIQKMTVFGEYKELVEMIDPPFDKSEIVATFTDIKGM